MKILNEVQMGFWEKFQFELEPLFSQTTEDGIILFLAGIIFFEINFMLFSWVQAVQLRRDPFYLKRKDREYYLACIIGTIQVIFYWYILYHAVLLLAPFFARL